MKESVKPLKKLNWVDWLSVALIGTGVISGFSVFWLPRLLGELLHLQAGFYGETLAVGYLQLLIAWFGVGTGILLLTVRPLVRLRSDVFPVLCVAATVVLWIFQDSICHFFDTLSTFSPDICTFAAPVLFPALLVWSAVFAIRNWQIVHGK